MADGDEARALSNGEIDRVIGGQSQPVIACIVEARGNAELEARIQVEMLVSGQGRVQRMRVRAPAYLFDNGFYPCARRAVMALRFPSTGAPTVVNAPYDLR